MDTTTSVHNSFSVETISETLSLDGLELLNKATHELHHYSQSFCTCIIELDQFTNRSTLLASASGVQLQRDDYLTPLTHSTCTFVTKSNQDHYVCKSNATQSHPDEKYIVEHNIESYLAIPLKTSGGEILGLLLSAYLTPITIKQQDDLIYVHKLFANIVTHNLKSKWLTARSKALVDQLSYEVSHDNLTGLLNRSYLSRKLEMLSEAQNIPFTLAYLDIDSFKSINDLYGNYIGDQIIKFVAKTIKDTIKDEQFAFRIAGDEFAFIIQASDPYKVCHNIVSHLEKGYRDPAHKINFSTSIGLANSVNQSVSTDQLILNASLALKECKKSRHLQVQCYDTHLSAQYYRKALIIDALRTELNKESISDSELYVVVQPIVNRTKLQWDSFEVLARWESHALGTIYPDEFVEAAEQSGLIIELGEHIVELACKSKLELEEGLGHRVTLSLNCSAHEITNSKRYLQHLLETTSEYGFKPNEFTIELTETVLLSQTEEVEEILNKLRYIGFKVALDDFGTGYSSLNYIHSYPIDCIKIDSTFVRNMLSNETAERVVWLIVQLAKQLEVALVAEGVEDSEALEKLYDMGCIHIQGYYFSKPDTAHNIVQQYYQRVPKQQQVSNG